MVFQVLDIVFSYNLLFGRLWIHKMQVVTSTYHQCIKFPFNGVVILIPGDKSMLTIVDSLVPHNRPTSDIRPLLIECKKKMKMMSINMREYTLDSTAELHVSPRSYRKPSKKINLCEPLTLDNICSIEGKGW